MIPYGRQDVTSDDIKSVVKVLESDFLTQGPVVPKFEKKISEITQADHAVAVNSCTSGLHIACLALGLGPGDFLWTSPITFVASANCALYCGAKVDFVDVDPDTGLISIDSLRDKLIDAKKIGRLPKIVIPVHFAGQSCDMLEIYELSQEFGFRIIEDAAHAVGATYHEKPVGCCEYSDIAVFSFHPVKIITTGEGGLCLTNDINLANLMRRARAHGITRDPLEMKNSNADPWYYEQINLGFNYRLNDIQAALGISQLNRLEDYVNKREKIALWYDKKFNNLPVKTLTKKKHRNSSNHIYVIRTIDNAKSRDKLFSYLKNENIGVNVHYIPVYYHPYFNSKIWLKGAEEFYKSALTIPIFPALTEKELKFIFDKIEAFFSLN